MDKTVFLMTSDICPHIRRPVMSLWRLSEMMNAYVDNLSNGFTITVKVFDKNLFATCNPSVVNQVFSFFLFLLCSINHRRLVES